MSALIDWIRVNWSFLVLIIGFGLVFVLLRTHPTEEVDSLQALDMSLAAGQPTVIEFYSNFWGTCLLAKPFVDEVEKKLIGKADVIRLNVLSKVGQQAAARYGVRGVPTLIVVDLAGQAVYGQAGIPRPGQVIEQVDSLLAANVPSQ